MIQRRLFHHLSVAAVLSLLAFATEAHGQATPPPATTPQAAVPQRPRGPRPPPVNLKALPKDMSGDDVVKLMRQYERDLGVECEYCHARNPATGRNDFASDANPIKDRARIMIRMEHDINATYLTQLTDPAPANPVTCGTCHRGAAKPAVFVAKPDTHGPPPASAPTAPTQTK